MDSAPPPRLRALPVLGYSETTGLQYGATVFRTFRAGGLFATRPSSDAVYLAHTAHDQDKAYVQVERWRADNARRLRLRAEYLSYPLPFFGIGARAPLDAEEWYSAGVSTLQLFGQADVRPGTHLIGGYRWSRTRMRSVESGGLLAAGAVPGSDGGTVSQVQFGLGRDTRDHLFVPHTGTHARVVGSVAARSLGSAFAFQRVTVDARRYRNLGSDHVLAAQVLYDGVAGRVPFDQLPMIGADTVMRGLARGRYRDQHALALQAEYRSASWRRAGFVAFIGGASVARRAGDLTTNPWYATAGFGARVLLDQRDRGVLRLDLGFGKRSFALNFGFGEAF